MSRNGEGGGGGLKGERKGETSTLRCIRERRHHVTMKNRGEFQLNPHVGRAPGRLNTAFKLWKGTRPIMKEDNGKHEHDRHVITHVPPGQQVLGLGASPHGLGSHR